MTMITTNRPAAYSAPLSRFSVRTTFAHLYSVWRQRQVLKSLDSAALRDIGVTRAQADAEAKRSVWDAPDNWFC